MDLMNTCDPQAPDSVLIYSQLLWKGDNSIRSLPIFGIAKTYGEKIVPTKIHFLPTTYFYALFLNENDRI